MKILRTLTLALALPVTLAAQQPAAGPIVNPVTTVFRTRTLTLQRNLAQAFDSIPESKFGYKPTPAQLTIGYIAQHLVSDNYLFCNNFGAMKATQSAKDTTTADSVKALWPRDELITKVKASFTFCEENPFVHRMFPFGPSFTAKLAHPVLTACGGLGTGVESIFVSVDRLSPTTAT